MTHADWLILGYTTVIIIFGIVCYIGLLKLIMKCKQARKITYLPRGIHSQEIRFFGNDLHHCRNTIFTEINQVLRVMLS
ncbi:TPA_asm: hypothetical protein G4I96_002159 [Salmonella enterica subsp. diarizonae serovar 50:l,v:z35]|nr:hypothetical protein [Salmonella enterica subsp. diarizonae serovar 50:l,v:z35]